MGSYSAGAFNPAFVPGPKEVNALRGVLVGHVERGADVSVGGSSGFDVASEWVLDHIPAAKAVLNRLCDAGLVFFYECYFERDETTGLTAEGAAWCVAHLGLPSLDHNDRDTRAVIKTTIAPLFTRKPVRGPIASARKGVKQTTAWVRQTRYTPSEAEAEKARLYEAAAKGWILDRSLAAYCAHVTRRTAVAAE